MKEIHPNWITKKKSFPENPTSIHFANAPIYSVIEKPFQPFNTMLNEKKHFATESMETWKNLISLHSTFQKLRVFFLRIDNRNFSNPMFLYFFSISCLILSNFVKETIFFWESFKFNLVCNFFYKGKLWTKIFN